MLMAIQRARLRREVRRVALRRLGQQGVQVRRHIPPYLLEHPEATLGLTFSHVVAAHMIVTTTGLSFVQIGACDGITDDPIHDLVIRHGWTGILAEPQSRYFEKLHATYAGRAGIQLRNVAIGERNETRPLYQIDGDPGLPAWTAMIASFDLDTVLAHEVSIPGLREHIVAQDIQCVTFESLLADVRTFDILQIDVEGYDATLIDLFDFERWRPSIVQFEHKHLSVVEHDRALRRLHEHRYSVAVVGPDTVAYRNAIHRHAS